MNIIYYERYFADNNRKERTIRKIVIKRAVKWAIYLKYNFGHLHISPKERAFKIEKKKS